MFASIKAFPTDNLRLKYLNKMRKAKEKVASQRGGDWKGEGIWLGKKRRAGRFWGMNGRVFLGLARWRVNWEDLESCLNRLWAQKQELDGWNQS
jgi:hypothetical protein